MASTYTLYNVGCSHLVPVETVSQVFQYWRRWQTRGRWRVSASNVLWLKTLSYGEIHPYTYTRAIILLGGSNLVELYEENQANAETSRRDFTTPISNTIRFHTISLNIGCTILRIRQHLFKFIPKLYMYTHPPTSPTRLLQACHLPIHRRLLWSLSSSNIIPFHGHLSITCVTRSMPTITHGGSWGWDGASRG